MYVLELSHDQAILIDQLMQMMDTGRCDQASIDAAEGILDQLDRAGFVTNGYAEVYFDTYDDTFSASIFDRG